MTRCRVITAAVAPVAPVASVMLVGGMLAGCVDMPDPMQAIAADEAVQHYDEIAADVIAVLPDQSREWELTSTTRHVDDETGTCEYSPGNWDIDEPTETIDNDQGWQPWLDAVNPVLEEAGFSKVRKPTQQEAFFSIMSTDSYGATLVIYDSGTVRIHSARVDADPCTDATLGL